MSISTGSTCLVTGAAGFVGSHLAERLLMLGCRVVGVDNFFSGHRDNMASFFDHPEFVFYERDIVETGILQDIADNHPNLEYCFHLAAIVSVPYSLEKPEETLDVNHRATVSLLNDARRLGLRKFVFAGSAAEYGDDPRLPLHECYATDSTHHLSPYGKAKYMASCEVASGPNGVALRCFNIYGPRQDPRSPYSGVISRFVDRAKAGKPLTIFGTGSQTRDFVYVADIVDAYIRSAGIKATETRLVSGVNGSGACAAQGLNSCGLGTGAAPGLYNIGSGKSCSILELAQEVQEACGSSAGLEFLPERPGDIAHSLACIDAFRNATGWRPSVPLHEGLKNTLEH